MQQRKKLTWNSSCHNQVSIKHPFNKDEFWKCPWYSCIDPSIYMHSPQFGFFFNFGGSPSFSISQNIHYYLPMGKIVIKMYEIWIASIEVSYICCNKCQTTDAFKPQTWKVSNSRGGLNNYWFLLQHPKKYYNVNQSQLKLWGFPIQ